jgi:GT2 family glycosyltransferase
MSSPVIPVVIINFRQPRNTIACLQSILENEKKSDIRPIIVDAQPTPIFFQQLTREFGDWITYIPLEKNLGFTGANNVGIAKARELFDPQTIILLNDDTAIGPQALSKLDTTLHAVPRRGAAAPKIYFYPGCTYHQGYKANEKDKVLWYAGGAIDWPEVFSFHRGIDEVDRGHYNQAEPTEFATGCCVALNVQALQEVGTFDDDYFLYLEDLDLSQRLKGANWEVYYEPASLVWHKNAGSSGAGSPLHVYYQTRNRYLFGFRYGTWRIKIFLMKHFLQQYRQGNATIRLALRDLILERYGQKQQVH